MDNNDNKSLNNITDQTGQIPVRNDINNNADFYQTGQIPIKQEEPSSLNQAINNQINNQFSGKIERVNIHEDNFVNNHLQNQFTIGEETAEIVKQNNQAYHVEKNSKKIFLTDDEMLYNFVNTNYDKFVTRNFNFAAFFFNIIYYLFRKMYGYAFILMAITILISVFVKNVVILAGVSLLICFILGILTNKIYLKHCRNKIDNIRFKHPYADNETLLAICRKKGGTSILSIFIGFIVNIAVIMAIFIIYLVVFLKLPVLSAFNKIVGDFFDVSNINISIGGVDINISNSSTTTTKFAGIVENDPKVYLTNEFALNIPVKFSTTAVHSSEMFSYQYLTDSNNCKFTFSAVKGYESDEKFINEVKDYYVSGNPQLEKVSINNLTWYKLSFKDSYSDNYWYATTKNNKVFLMQYTISQDLDNNCSVYHNIIINSISPR